MEGRWWASDGLECLSGEDGRDELMRGGRKWFWVVKVLVALFESLVVLGFVVEGWWWRRWWWWFLRLDLGMVKVEMEVERVSMACLCLDGNESSLDNLGGCDFT